MLILTLKINLNICLLTIINRQMCKENGCNIIPVFNKEGKTKALYCLTHKKMEWLM